MSELKMTCPQCDARTSAVGEAFRNWEPCPYCALPPEQTMRRREQALTKAVLPRLAYELSKFQRDGHVATAVVLPSDLNPGGYTGSDATDTPARIMGLPVIWGDRLALVFDIPLAKPKDASDEELS